MSPRALALIAALLPAAARADELSIAIYQPGGGFLVTDSKLRVPIEIVVRGDNGPIPIEKASVTPGAGKAHDVQITGQGRILFYYQPPDKLRTGTDVGELRFERPGGSAGVFTLTLRVTPYAAPKLSLDVNPTRFDANEPPNGVRVAAAAQGGHDVALTASAGGFGADAPTRSGKDVELVTSYRPPKELPTDAPSHVSVIATAAGPGGWAARSTGISVLSRLRVSLAIEPGHQLVLEGSENKVAPVMAAADGKTVIEDVVRYGAPVRAFAVRGGKRRELSVAVPSGLVPLATVAAIPGQAVADGGVGPSLVVAVPPGPFGEAPIWPDLEVQGAELLSQGPVPGAPNARVLVLRRPKRAETVTVLGDGAAIGTIPFGAGLGESLEIRSDTAAPGERAAVRVRVTDAFGSLADQPVPTVRAEGGEELEVKRVGPGDYRAVVPPSVTGENGARVAISAQIMPPKPLGDGPVELVTAQTAVRLEWSAAVRPGGDEGPNAPNAPKVPRGPSWRFGLLGAALAGTTFNGELMLGAGALFELRPPIWDERLSLRAGVELFRASGTGSLAFPTARTDASVTYAGAVFPVLLGVSLQPTDGLELSARFGVELRSEAGVLDAGGDRVGGATRFGAGLRGGLEAAFELGPGWICASGNVGGIGTDVGGFSDPELVTFEGSLTHVRLDAGYRLWF